MTNGDLRETREQKLPMATTFSPRNSLSKLSSPLTAPSVDKTPRGVGARSHQGERIIQPDVIGLTPICREQHVYEETLAATIKHGPIHCVYGWAGSVDERRGRILRQAQDMGLGFRGGEVLTGDGAG